MATLEVVRGGWSVAASQLAGQSPCCNDVLVKCVGNVGGAMGSSIDRSPSSPGWLVCRLTRTDMPGRSPARMLF